jgi:hypothetical protein
MKDPVVEVTVKMNDELRERLDILQHEVELMVVLLGKLSASVSSLLLEKISDEMKQE